MRVLLRTLTRKSILGFGYQDLRDLSIQMILDLKRSRTLISAYYGLEKINFTDDILNEIGITEEHRIKKPSKLPREEISKKVNEIVSNNWKGATDNERIKASFEKNKSINCRIKRGLVSRRKSNGNKMKQQRRNHGHK